MALLFVIPPLPPASASDAYGWALWSADGRQVREHGSAVPALLPSADEVLLGVPAAVLSWHQVTLPQGSLGGNVRVRALLNGLLEDRLLDDPEQLHFALAPGAQAGAPAWVAACNRAWLRAAVQAIESTGRRVGVGRRRRRPGHRRDQQERGGRRKDLGQTHRDTQALRGTASRLGSRTVGSRAPPEAGLAASYPLSVTVARHGRGWVGR